MKKQKLLILLVGIFCLISMPANSDDIDFIVSATVPLANGVSITATQVDAVTNKFGQSVNNLNFNPLKFDTVNNIYLADHYFAIDVGATGGTGSPDVTVTYVEGAKPVGQTKGLGFKSTTTFIKVTQDNQGKEIQTPMNAHGPKKLLKDLVGGESIDDTELVNAFLRMYVGVFPGDDQVIINAGGEPFSPADKSGNYDGTLTVSATVT